MTQAKKHWISPLEALSSAEEGFTKYGLDSDPNIASILREGHAGKPLLVERLDRPESAYYLVPWMIERKIALIAEVDASGEGLLSMSPIPKPITEFVLSPKEAIDRASCAFPEYEFGQPHLVWRPCRESTSSLRPFFQIPHKEGVVYVDMSGSVIQKLTILGSRG